MSVGLASLVMGIRAQDHGTLVVAVSRTSLVSKASYRSLIPLFLIFIIVLPGPVPTPSCLLNYCWCPAGFVHEDIRNECIPEDSVDGTIRYGN